MIIPLKRKFISTNLKVNNVCEDEILRILSEYILLTLQLIANVWST